MKALEKSRLLEEQTLPIWFAFTLYLLAHILGLFMLLLLPSSFRIGAGLASPWETPFGMLLLVSLLSAVWFLSRAAGVASPFRGRLAVMLIPLIMSLATAGYSYLAMGCADAGRQMLQRELVSINEWIEQATRAGRPIHRYELRRKKQLEEALK